MPSIKWKVGDTFQVLSTQGETIPGGSNSLDAEVYGVFAKDHVIVVAKTSEENPETCSARTDFSGKWQVMTSNTKISEGYPGAVPLNLEDQWVPHEAFLTLTAARLALKKGIK